MRKRALITGITGQDGSYLAELLLSLDYEVHGLIRRSSAINRQRIDHLPHDAHNPSTHLFLHYGDVASMETLIGLVQSTKPDEIYHLAAQSHVRVSFEIPEYTGDVTALGAVRILEAIRLSGINTRFYNASSSEMYGNARPPQNEHSPLQPRSPYAAAKVYAHWSTSNYREGYGLYACNGILFNHESPRRGETFVTRKITCGVAQILAGRGKKVYLGNLDAKRDWGYAPEYVECMWRMLQQDQPGDYVLGTGEAHSVKEFAKEAFSYVGLDWKNHVEIDPRHMRPTEVDFLLADATKAKEKLDWHPKITFRQLVRIMVDADMTEVGMQPIGEGNQILRSNFKEWHCKPPVAEALRPMVRLSTD
jgi:GDPmannose 4,6-dehydratase